MAADVGVLGGQGEFVLPGGCGLVAACGEDGRRRRYSSFSSAPIRLLGDRHAPESLIGMGRNPHTIGPSVQVPGTMGKRESGISTECPQNLPTRGWVNGPSSSASFSSTTDGGKRDGSQKKLLSASAQ